MESITSPESVLDYARPILGAQPFSELLGARIIACADGLAVIEIDVDDRHRQQYGLVHGGVFGFLADMAISFAAGSVLGPSLVSTGYQVDLIGNTRSGVLSAVGRVGERSSDEASVDVEISAIGPDGISRTCARATGTARLTRRGREPSGTRTDGN